MPLDSTQIHLETAEREKIFAFGSPLTDQLTLLYHQWVGGTDNHSPTPTLFDPVAVTYAIRPDLCPAKPMRIEVDDKGFTRLCGGEPNAQVCLQVGRTGLPRPAAEPPGAGVSAGSEGDSGSHAWSDCSDSVCRYTFPL